MNERYIRRFFYSYIRATYTKPMGVEQHDQLKKAFYAGAHSAFTLMVGSSEDLSEDEAVEIMNDIQAELNTFIEGLATGN